jgi:hypothetical protein
MTTEQKFLGRNYAYFPPIIPEAKNAWSYTSTYGGYVYK